MNRAGPITKDIVLVGGGHAHVHVLTNFAMRPLPGVRITLVTRDLATPYSGMLPGVVAGLYALDEAHIDLVRLAAATGTRLIHAEARGFDRASKHVLLYGRPPIAYDLLSIDVGIAPALDQIAGAAQHAIAVKPIGGFLAKFSELIEGCRRPGGLRRIVAIGGGAGGVELLLSVRTRLLSEAKSAGISADAYSFTLVTDGEILATHNSKVRAAFRRVLAARGVQLREHSRVRAITAQTVGLDNGEAISADAVLVTTEAAAPGWFAGAGLDLDPNGFIAVGPTLQSKNDPDVFAAGDCAALVASPREKAGVYAVRAGPPLAENLRRRARGEPLKAWYPQRRHLALISTGERYAVASRGAFKAEGAWLWALKDWIDRRWMRMYQDVDAMVARMAARPSTAESIAIDDMRCGGCAAKIGPGPLSRALARLAPGQASSDVLLGLDAPDDAAVLAAPAGKSLVQTVDFFRAFIDDPFVFGEIAANHALNDIFAMGGAPRFALATAVVPAAHSAKMEEDLFQMLAGARACLDREGVALVGGHSSEGADLALGLSVTGEIDPEKIVRKAGLKTGDTLILTRPLGTGILFAAAMRARAKADWIEGALLEMRRSNCVASGILVSHGASAMTDVTGFGLIGHLGEMIKASHVAAQLDLAAVPLYAGVLSLARAGIASTLLPENLWLADVLGSEVDDTARAILFDPQTSGGLLAGVPAAQAEKCVAQLIASGCAGAAIVGQIVDAVPGARVTTVGALK
jgi:selenide, water dikinase